MEAIPATSEANARQAVRCPRLTSWKAWKSCNGHQLQWCEGLTLTPTTLCDLETIKMDHFEFLARELSELNNMARDLGIEPCDVDDES